MNAKRRVTTALAAVAVALLVSGPAPAGEHMRGHASPRAGISYGGYRGYRHEQRLGRRHESHYYQYFPSWRPDYRYRPLPVYYYNPCPSFSPDYYLPAAYVPMPRTEVQLTRTAPESSVTSQPKTKRPEAAQQPATKPFPSLVSKMLGGDGRVNVSFAAGEYSLRSGSPERAVEEFSRARQEDPRDAAAALALGLAQFMAGDFGAASEAVREGLAHHPDPERVRLDPQAAFGDTGGYEQQLEALDGSLTKDARDAGLQLLAGFLCYATGDWEGAAVHLQAAETLDPADQASARLRALAVRQALQQEAGTTEGNP